MLWAITCYFNPVGYRRRLQNYRFFRDRLEAPLATVEWSLSGDFVLTPADADILIQVQGGDILWQKERLLNIAIGALPPECDVLAWLDCDVIFGDEHWMERAGEALERSSLVHLFDDQYDLPPDVGPERISRRSEDHLARSVVARFATGEVSEWDLRSGARTGNRTAWGFAWAAKRTLLDKHGLYDCCIVGGGDEAIWCAAAGEPGRPIITMAMDERRRRHYLDWARPFHEDVRGRVEWLRGPLFHLWHGDLAGRRYRDRHRGVASRGFDPENDIALTEQGCWRWKSHKPGLQAYVKDYFAQRNEDDEARDTSTSCTAT